MSEQDIPSFRPCLQRGELLRDQGRYAEAEKYFQQAIAQQPNNAEGYHELAFCYCDWEGHDKQALKTIDRAIELDPNSSENFALRAWLLGNLDRYKEAVATADQALALNPNNILALNSQSRAFGLLCKWVESEEVARRVLALHAQNEVASNLLAVALRQQGRVEESEAVSSSLLSHDPDSSMTQCNAGWTALHAGDYRRANQHFMEALRLNPESDFARRGLLHAFNSRVWIYRLYFSFVAWISRHRKETRYLFFGVIYVAYRVVVTTLRNNFGHEGLWWSMVLIALYLAVFGFGKSFGNLFLLLDRFARHALTRKEKLWTLFPAVIYGGILASLVVQHAWVQAGVLITILAFFLWGVLAHRIQDAFARRTSADPISSSKDF